MSEEDNWCHYSGMPSPNAYNKIKMSDIKVGDEVMWINSPYIVEKVAGGKLLLKQNFSVRTTLTSMVNIDEVKKVKG